MGPPRWPPRGPWPVQLRLSGHTSAEYVARKGWLEARLTCCPVHGQAGGCSFARHGTYSRVEPSGTLIARYYCPEAHQTFSLLTDFLSCRLKGELREVEDAVRAAEQAESAEKASGELRPEVELPGVLRWLRRRVKAVRVVLLVLVTLLPETLPVAPTLLAVQEHLQLKAGQVLMALREIGAKHLQQLSPPLGFRPPGGGERPRGGARQQQVGAGRQDVMSDPPAGRAIAAEEEVRCRDPQIPSATRMPSRCSGTD